MGSVSLPIGPLVKGGPLGENTRPLPKAPDLRRIVLHEALGPPFAGPPTAHEDDAANVLVEHEAYPHADKAVAKGDTDDIAQTDGNAPLEDDADDDGIDGIARGSQGAYSKDVGCAPNLKEPVDDEYPDTHGDNLRIVGKGAEDAASCDGQQGGAGERDNHGPAEEVVAQEIGRLVTALPDEVAHEDVAALRDAEAEEIDEHNHVGAVGAGCQRLVANLVDEERDDHLRQTVGDVLTHGRYADIEQVA